MAIGYGVIAEPHSITIMGVMPRLPSSRHMPVTSRRTALKQPSGAPATPRLPMRHINFGEYL